ncbi:hypothetical protein KUCAC02_037675, partial [Chaenocephalus aceratus]
VPSSPYSVRLSAVSQRLATVTFMKPDSHGGVPISFYLVQYKDVGSQEWRDVKSHSIQTTVVLTALEPNTTYEVRVAAVNGKGQGEFSHTESFQTLPIREPSPPAVHGQRGMGKAYRLGLVKQDDGGMPIVEYIVKYRTDKEEQWMTKLVPGMNDFAMLQPLQWNTRYEVEITARNVKGLSEPSFYQFFMPQKPDITGNSPITEDRFSFARIDTHTSVSLRRPYAEVMIPMRSVEVLNVCFSSQRPAGALNPAYVEKGIKERRVGAPSLSSPPVTPAQQCIVGKSRRETVEIKRCPRNVFVRGWKRRERETKICSP